MFLIRRGLVYFEGEFCLIRSIDIGALHEGMPVVTDNMIFNYVRTQIKLVAPGLMPKLGKAGSLQSRQAILHSLVHTESWAIDLSWVINLNICSLQCCFFISSVCG